MRIRRRRRLPNGIRIHVDAYKGEEELSLHTEKIGNLYRWWNANRERLNLEPWPGVTLGPRSAGRPNRTVSRETARK